MRLLTAKTVPLSGSLRKGRAKRVSQIVVVFAAQNSSHSLVSYEKSAQRKFSEIKWLATASWSFTTLWSLTKRARERGSICSGVVEPTVFFSPRVSYEKSAQRGCQYSVVLLNNCFFYYSRVSYEKSAQREVQYSVSCHAGLVGLDFRGEMQGSSLDDAPIWCVPSDRVDE